jgi:lipoprotein-anchoring transpeptidase ErfK/SrfK
MRINNIKDAKKLQAGKSIKVVKGPFHAKVDRNRFIISIYLGDTLVQTWPVGLGSPGRQTPKGKWRVQAGRKQINPAWWDREEGKHYLPDDPKNPLGERWIGLVGIEGEAVGRDGFGIHGTIRPEEIKKAASRGCIRLFNKDVMVLYDLLVEDHSFVWVED